jgi:hypothetical protein
VKTPGHEGDIVPNNWEGIELHPIWAKWTRYRNDDLR